MTNTRIKKQTDNGQGVWRWLNKVGLYHPDSCEFPGLGGRACTCYPRFLWAMFKEDRKGFIIKRIEWLWFSARWRARRRLGKRLQELNRTTDPDTMPDWLKQVLGVDK